MDVRAQQLRSMHRAGDPLVLVNVWDAASAQRVEAAGARAIGTSSAAMCASLGAPDDPTTPLELLFAAIARIVDAVNLPVTADLLDGYGLGGQELVDRLLDAGAVGCNIEDSDHRRPGTLVEPDVAAGRLAEVRAAARLSGVEIVINARIDSYLHAGDPAAAWPDIVERARTYRDAGADCIYPVRLTDPTLVAQLVDEVGAPVNANIGGAVTVADVAAAGASRVSIGPRAHGVALAALDGLAADLLGGRTE